MLPGDDPVERFREAYATKDTPWDSGVPSTELVRVLDAGLLPGRTVLELGCGTGTNAIEFARRKYRVTAVDLIELPIERAREKARRAGVAVDFRVGDLRKMDLGGPYDVVFDIGLYHGLRNRDLPGLLKTIERVSRHGTRWLSLAGNAREPLSNGPPVVREEEFRAELGPLFNFLEVREFRFELGGDFRPLAWSILMERR
ncbi:MAG: class I SAM-dependent methyltransferase [Thermoplasmata archaeon]|nr:class I SAM-dependent methyltransferase [Thermoplasmata archaeon]